MVCILLWVLCKKQYIPVPPSEMHSIKKHALGFFCCWGSWGFWGLGGFFLFDWVFSSARFVPCAATYPGWVFEVEEDASYLVVSKVGFVVLGADTTSLLFFFFLERIKNTYVSQQTL